VSDLNDLVGIHLEDLSKSPFVQPLMRDSETELIGDEFHLQIRPHGIAFVASFDGRVSSIQFFSEGYQQFRRFAGELPEGISFKDSRSSLQRRLGKPDSSGGGTVIQFFGQVPKWDRFDRLHYSLHIQFVEDESSISLVSLMRPDAVPR